MFDSPFYTFLNILLATDEKHFLKMIFFIPSLVLVLASITLAHSLGPATEPQVISPPRPQLSRHPAPLENPYFVPGRQFNLDFYRAAPRNILPKPVVDQLLRNAFRRLSQRINQQGDGPMPQRLNALEEVLGTRSLIIDTSTAPPVLTWGDAKAIIIAVREKVYHDGYCEWVAAVKRNQDGLLLGEVFLQEADDEDS
ncbi:MAG: hypothetical protein Q9221_002396 [Calogaya cf. arnoldii]